MKDHNMLLEELKKQFQPVFENSPDGVYIWVDETHMICNEKLAKMFGYSVKELVAKSPFLDNFVAEDDQERFSMNYHSSVAKLSHPVTFRFMGVKKDGSKFHAETDMIPISFDGHAIAYHFVRELR